MRHHNDCTLSIAVENGALDRIHDAGELGQFAVARGIDEGP
jgi:hypothetical protein